MSSLAAACPRPLKAAPVHHLVYLIAEALVALRIVF
jgi:hypothetical protein